jgi:hypothetical protein
MKTPGKKYKKSHVEKEDEIFELLLKAQEESYQSAFETAVRTGTSLIFSRNGKIVRVKPQFEYVLVPIKPKKRKKPQS